MGSCLPCRPDNNPSETRTRFLPGLKNSCDKLSVPLGSTLYQKPMNILPAGGGGRTSSPRRLLGSSDTLPSERCVHRSPRQFARTAA